MRIIWRLKFVMYYKGGLLFSLMYLFSKIFFVEMLGQKDNIGTVRPFLDFSLNERNNFQHNSMIVINILFHHILSISLKLFAV